jgi:hypothetical protein
MRLPKMSAATEKRVADAVGLLVQIAACTWVWKHLGLKAYACAMVVTVILRVAGYVEGQASVARYFE